MVYTIYVSQPITKLPYRPHDPFPPPKNLLRIKKTLPIVRNPVVSK